MLFNRREFTAGALAASASLLSGCTLDRLFKKDIKLSLVGPESDRGHFLRDMKGVDYPVQTQEKIEQTIVLGGGASGLAALSYLKTKGIHDILLLELGSEIGGNARAGSHALGRYPWGAHYLPIPSKSNISLISFLYRSGAIADYDTDGKPFYRDEFLVHSPEERLFRFGSFQSGLYPSMELSGVNVNQSKDFYRILAFYKEINTSDGKRPFDIPINNSSRDMRLMELDSISGEEFLIAKGISDPRVFWYADYACRDDYGTSLKDVSAWALLHYFLARESYKANKSDQDILTWPEGNNWLISQLSNGLESRILPNQIVLSVNKVGEMFKVRSFSVEEGLVVERQAKSVICSLPEFIARRVLDSSLQANLPQSKSYNPWVVSNLILKSDNAYQMPWDSVSYHSSTLGFVRANHQDMFKQNAGSILTHYNAFVEGDSKEKRQELFSSTLEELAQPSLMDLKSMYPLLDNQVEEVRLWIWAHAMRKVSVGTMSEVLDNDKVTPIDGFSYAHTDSSAISIFEEAFYRGERAGERTYHYLKA